MAIPPIQLSAQGTNGFVIHGPGGAIRAGWSVASAGNINRDGFDDLVIGVPFSSVGGGMLSGDAFVVLARPAGSDRACRSTRHIPSRAGGMVTRAGAGGDLKKSLIAINRCFQIVIF